MAHRRLCGRLAEFPAQVVSDGWLRVRSGAPHSLTRASRLPQWEDTSHALGKRGTFNIRNGSMSVLAGPTIRHVTE